MVGMERSILPLIAEDEFGLASRSAILSFLISFGIVKAISNLLAGRLADTVGRRKLLVAGWIVGIPVPFLLMWAPSWNWIIAANVLLGINQGLCWSTAVIMKIDLAGPRQRGLAMGLNEFAGYVAVAVAAYWSATIAADYGLRPYPFYLGVGFSLAGLLLSSIFVRETHQFVQAESILSQSPIPKSQTSSSLPFSRVFSLTSWKNPILFSSSQAGLVSNLNDGVAWGLFPLFFVSLGFSIEQVGMLAGVYPLTWGMLQVGTGALSDRIGRKWMIAAGMWFQGAAILLVTLATTFNAQLVAMVGLGVGTALVYPTLLAAVGDAAEPAWRASAIGVYRLWRDLGYTLGAIVAGIVADAAGMSAAIGAVGVLTSVSGLLVAACYRR
jgi:MFS family permease